MAQLQLPSGCQELSDLAGHKSEPGSRVALGSYLPVPEGGATSDNSQREVMRVGGYPKTHLTNSTNQQSLLDLVSSHWACKALSLILESLGLIWTLQ